MPSEYLYKKFSKTNFLNFHLSSFDGREIGRRNENNNNDNDNIDDENEMFIRLQFPNDFRKRLMMKTM
jgi:hypothetical protein